MPWLNREPITLKIAEIVCEQGNGDSIGFQFRILGPLEVLNGGRSLALGAPKQRALLARLLVGRGTPLSPDRLIEDVWVGRRGSDALHSVQVYVSGLRKVLEGAARIDRVDGCYCLSLHQSSELDAERFETLLERGRQAALAGEAEQASALLEEGLALWRGRALGELGDADFVRAEADRLEELRLAALEERIEADLLLGRHEQLAAELERLVAEHPLRQVFRRQLMLALYRAGRQADALETFRAGRERSVEELGLEPGRELHELQLAILRQEPGLLIESSRLRTRRHLPTPATALIGRRAEIGTIIRLLERPDARLLTLTGPGGSGKTRLALQAAHELAGRFQDGVYFVDLAPVKDPAMLVAAIAQAVGVRERPGESLAVLSDHLRRRRLLLLLDNFEHLDEAGPLVSDLLAAAPGLCVLVTSRLRLRLYGEHEYGVGPLSLVDEAVPLFLARAQAAGVDADWGHRAEEVCLRLDCLPLAIELAAARARQLGPDQLLASLAQRLDLATGGPRDVPARQRTLRSTLEWSERLLDDELREAFAALAVFVGGWTIEAARDVTGVPPDASERLAEHSLVERRCGRYVMLETIREYARERLEEEGNADSLKARHARYFLGLAEETESKAFAPEAGLWLNRVESEVNNLRAAMDRGMRRDGAIPQGRSVAARIASALLLFWVGRGYLREGRDWLQRALGSPDSPVDDVRAKAMTRLAWLHYRLADTSAAVRLLRESLATTRRTGNESETAYALSALGCALLCRGDYAQGVTLLEETREIRGRLNDSGGVMTALLNLGITEAALCHRERAESLFLESLAMARSAQDQTHLSRTLTNYAELLSDFGEFDAAETCLDEAEEIYSSCGDKLGLSYAAALRGVLALRRGRLEEARELSEAALRDFHRMGDVEYVLATLDTLVEVDLGLGSAAEAARLMGAVEALRSAWVIPRQPRRAAAWAACAKEGRRVLGDGSFDTARGEGACWDFEETVERGRETHRQEAHAERGG